jgi:hypothetical protein
MGIDSKQRELAIESKISEMSKSGVAEGPDGNAIMPEGGTAGRRCCGAGRRW